MRLCIATPTHSGTVCVPFVTSLANTLKALTAGGIEVQWRALSFASFIHAARDRMAREFMASDYTDLLFADADMGWDTEGLLRMLAHDVDVVGAICPKRRDPIEWAVNLLKDADGNRIEQDGLMQCAYVGTALMRIRRGVFERMGAGHYFDAGYEGQGFIGEDAWFCREFRRAGGRVWADPTVTVSHTGPKDWRGSYSEWINEDHDGHVRPPLLALPAQRSVHIPVA